jgi:hypothetical protein
MDYDTNVFINCPFDEEYRPLFEAVVFAVMISGFTPRCALEAHDAGQGRLDMIMRIIAECKYGIHDISRTELNESGLPRFNMPLELGLDFGCSKYGPAKFRAKKLLVLDESEHRYQQFISDISGQDIKAHGREPREIIRAVRDWLRTESKVSKIPGGVYMHERYQVFRESLPKIRQALKLDLTTLPFLDLTATMLIWLQENETGR